VECRQLAGDQSTLRTGAGGDDRRGLTKRETAFAAPAATAFVAVLGTAATNGGYFPSDRGWAALGLLLVAAWAIIVLERVCLARLDAVFLAFLAAFTGWVAISAVWSTSLAQPLLELERAIVYLAGAFALLLTTPKRAAPALLAGALAGITAVCAYALATRLFPDAFGDRQPGESELLAQPLGYSNALAILAVIGALIALGFAADGEKSASRGAAAAALVVLASTLFFTFSRGGWLALTLGVAASIALHPRRTRFALAAGIQATPAAVAVFLCSRSEQLTHAADPLNEAARAGHRLAPALVALAACSAVLGAANARRGERKPIGRRARILLVATLASIAVVVAIVALARFDSPTAPGADGSSRLFSTSSSFRTDYWRVARSQYGESPWLGTGAGSFERYWLERRSVPFFSRDAHNLYLETLAEVGPVGLLLLAGALAVPLVALARARAQPFAPAAGAAYIAFLAHAAIDWDWEVPTVTLAALTCALALLARGRQEGEVRLSNRLRAAGLLLLSPLLAFVVVLHVGNTALLRSSEAAASGDLERAEVEARRALRWAPWSHEPWQRLGEAALAQGDVRLARASFRSAIERDGENWLLWYDLAEVSAGGERIEALRQVRRLNPLGSEVGSPLVGN